MPEQNYTVKRKQEITQFDEAMQPQVVYRIYATSKGGTYFHIEVPERDLPRAGELLSKRAAELDSIK